MNNNEDDDVEIYAAIFFTGFLLTFSYRNLCQSVSESVEM
jgi:hypothetical protein